MPRPRVLSFMSQWGGGALRSPSSSTPSSPTPPTKSDSPTANHFDSPTGSPKPPPVEGKPRHSHSRSSSATMTYQPPVIATSEDTPAELAPIFSYLNSHSNKLYQEGYFLKLHDLDSRGKPSADRTWNECFAQLVGTVLSLWDAAQLDAAGDNGEVLPTFINLTDASIKMIEALPMNGVDGQSLQNVLSISTAANNRYLLHFNSLHSLTQWTAGIRLAMYEYTTLQEAYTGSIIAGKGKWLNNIRMIMERSRFPTEDWVRVRFGAGTPWRRCWCIVTPPDEKELTKIHKAAKKRSAYEKPPTVKGDIKFYETRKVTKKSRPIATIKDTYAAYAIYPSSKDLIDQSTLMKIEGKIVVHSTEEMTTEGFVFLMPEVHPAVTGFEIMLRFLLPIFDTFGLYGRPTRLIADVLDSRSLMFAMPNDRRYGYLDLIDVAGLIHTEGSQSWTEYEWRKQMKQLTQKRLSAPKTAGRSTSGDQSYHSPSRSINFAGPGSQQSARGLNGANGARHSGEEARSAPGSRHGSPNAKDGMYSGPNTRNASDVSVGAAPRSQPHQRSSSDVYKPHGSSRLSFETPRPGGSPPRPPQHGSVSPQPPPHGMSPQGSQGPPPPSQGPPPPTPTHFVPFGQTAQGAPPSNYSQNPYQQGFELPSHNQDSHQMFEQSPPPPPKHGVPTNHPMYVSEQDAYLSRDQFPPVQDYGEEREEEGAVMAGTGNAEEQQPNYPPMAPDMNRPFRPVAAPPSFAHKSNAQPPLRPYQMPEMRRANSAMDAETLAQLKDANPAGARNGDPFGPPLQRNFGSQQNMNSSSQSGPPPAPSARHPYALPNNGPSYMPSNNGSPYASYNSGQPYVLPSNGTSPTKRLPTIPGTPAVEHESYTLAPEEQRQPRDLTREKSSIARKPVGSSRASPNKGGSPATSRSPNPGRSPHR